MQHIGKYDTFNKNYEVNGEKYFDMDQLSAEEIKHKIELEDLMLINNCYELVEDIFVSDDRFRDICVRQLICNASVFTQHDLQQTLRLLGKQETRYVYGIILSVLDRPTNRGVDATNQYSAVQMVNYLLHHGYAAPEDMLVDIVNKIDEYTSQSGVNFQVYAHAFSVYAHLAERGMGQCLELLVRHLQSETLKVRDQAFDALLGYLLATGADEARLREVAAYDFMLAKPAQLKEQVLAVRAAARMQK